MLNIFIDTEFTSSLFAFLLDNATELGNNYLECYPFYDKIFNHKPKCILYDKDNMLL